MKKRQDYSKRAENGITWAQQESRNSLIGCANSSVLAFNTNCNVRTKGGAYYSLGATGSWPKRASAFGFPGRGQCGKPLVFGGKKELLFTDPDPGYGWLWTMMIRDPSVGPWKISEFGGFPGKFDSFELHGKNL